MEELFTKLEGFKSAGNQAFAANDFGAALAAYNAATEAAASSGITTADNNAADNIRHILSQVLANRSAVQLSLGANDAALADATSSVHFAYKPHTFSGNNAVFTIVKHLTASKRSDAAPPDLPVPSWNKPLLRQGKALEVLGRHREAATAFEMAKTADPYDATAIRMFKQADAIAKKEDQVVPVRSLAHFLGIFRHTPDVRLRLATLATFWNSSTNTHRWHIFKQFLLIVAGPEAVDESLAPGEISGPHISHFAPEVLTSLPMENYSDITLPTTWIAFYEACDEESRVLLFNGCWDLCSVEEQRLIIKDIRTFFVPGEVNSATDTAASKLEDGDSEADAGKGDAATTDKHGAASAADFARLAASGLSAEDIQRILTAAGTAGRPVPIHSSPASGSGAPLADGSAEKKA